MGTALLKAAGDHSAGAGRGSSVPGRAVHRACVISKIGEKAAVLESGCIHRPVRLTHRQQARSGVTRAALRAGTAPRGGGREGRGEGDVTA